MIMTGEKRSTQKKNLSQRHFVHRKSLTSGPKTKTGLRGVPAKQHSRIQFHPHSNHNASVQGCLGKESLLFGKPWSRIALSV
jgi:hypothetical protein